MYVFIGRKLIFNGDLRSYLIGQFLPKTVGICGVWGEKDNLMLGKAREEVFTPLTFFYLDWGHENLIMFPQVGDLQSRLMDQQTV